MARRPLHPEDARLWSLVTATVRPSKGRTLPAREAMPPLKDINITFSGETPSEAGGATPSKRSRVKKSSSSNPSTEVSGATLQHPFRPPVVHHPMRHHFPEIIEPRRKRRISTAREPIGARLDLHGLDQDQARVAVHAFILRAYQDGARAVLIITGKGALGDGVLRRRTPDWLAEAVVRPMVAGLSQAERHHGGEGALYVALKRAHHS